MVSQSREDNDSNHPEVKGSDSSEQKPASTSFKKSGLFVEERKISDE